MGLENRDLNRAELCASRRDNGSGWARRPDSEIPADTERPAETILRGLTPIWLATAEWQRGRRRQLGMYGLSLSFTSLSVSQ